MNYDKQHKELQELIDELGISITDEMKPSELFDAIVKLLAAHAAKKSPAKFG